MHWRSMYSAATGFETPAVAVDVGGVSGCRLCAAVIERLGKECARCCSLHDLMGKLIDNAFTHMTQKTHFAQQQTPLDGADIC